MKLSQLSLFADDPPPAAAKRKDPVTPVTFSGPYARRALVITPCFLAWVAWRLANCAEYGAAYWLLDASGLRAWSVEVFEVVSL